HGISPGVTLSSPGMFDGVKTGPVGSILFGPGKYPDDPTLPPGPAGNGGFSRWITSSYTVTATGNYRLRFVVSNLTDDIYPSALVCGDVRITGAEEEPEGRLAAKQEKIAREQQLAVPGNVNPLPTPGTPEPRARK